MQAATIFLQGSELPFGGRQLRIDIVPVAVTRVADRLRSRDADAVAAIVSAVDTHRREGSWRSRESVIEAVTAAVVPLQPALAYGAAGGER